MAHMLAILRHVDLGGPYRILEAPADSEVVRVLAGTSGALSARQVARRVHAGSRPTVLRSLTRLARLGVLDLERVGRSHMFSLNREHIATPALEQLVALRERMVEAVRGAVHDLDPPPLAAGLFGSAARGDGDADSDIDLLLVHAGEQANARWVDQAAALAALVERRTGNRVAIHEVSRGKLAALAAERAPIIADLRRDYLPLLGEPIGSLLDTVARIA